LTKNQPIGKIPSSIYVPYKTKRMKGKIPNTAEIILESNEDQWLLLSNKLINELKTSAIIEINQKKVRIGLSLHVAIAPDESITKIVNRVHSNFEEQTNAGVARIMDFLVNKLEAKKWIFIGEINGENKIPIIITHYSVISLTIYSIKIESETRKNFFPNFTQN
jgi:hypothetical protein